MYNPMKMITRVTEGSTNNKNTCCQYGTTAVEFYHFQSVQTSTKNILAQTLTGKNKAFCFSKIADQSSKTRMMMTQVPLGKLKNTQGIYL